MQRLVEKITGREKPLVVVGLGYVGLPLAVEFAKHADVVGFDVSEDKVAVLRDGRDPTGELDGEELSGVNIRYTTDPALLAKAGVIVVTVPTPLDSHNNPDMGSLLAASKTIGQNLSRGTLVVYESTVYPGATEDVCLPILEEESGLKCGVDFGLGYSPERINPGDREHSLASVIKVVSGADAKTLDDVAALYSLVVEAGVHRAPTIKTAELSKVLENTQRDINIALMNEISIICDKAGIDTRAVLEAAGTKWNFLKFTPGLVGGHCIGVDPYYLTYKAEELDYKAQVVLAGRSINDSMGKHVAEGVIKGMIRCSKTIQASRVLVLGLTFKENVRDIRNSKVKDVIDELSSYGVEVEAYDPVADPKEAAAEYGITLLDGLEGAATYDAVVMAVSHRAFEGLTVNELKKFFPPRGDDPSKCDGVLADVRMRYRRDEVEGAGLVYWSL